MDDSKGQVRRACGAKTREELASLEGRGAVMAGNAYADLLVVKGEPGPAELAGGAPLSGPDGKALRAAFTALGYAPEDWSCLMAVSSDGSPLPAALLLEALAVLGPMTVVLADEAAAALARDALASDLVELASLEQAMLAPGYVVQVRGLRVMNLGGFEASLGDDVQKQLMWARLKQLPPLGEPY